MIRNRENEGCVFTHKNDFPKYDSHGLKQDSDDVMAAWKKKFAVPHSKTHEFERILYSGRRYHHDT